MRRLALAAMSAAIAFASSVDASSIGAAPRTNTSPTARVRSAVVAEWDMTAAERAALPDAPSAEDDEQAMREARIAAAARARRAPARTRTRLGGDAVWRALAVCESHANPTAVSKSGKYRGAFQFSMASWQSLGYSGDPIEHPYATQLEAAKRLQARSGWGQWPTCARRLGLL